MPDPRISLCVYGDSTGLRYWNNPNDPMPIKTYNDMPIEECIYEETDDYIIYCDRTTMVMNAMPNLYTRFLEWEKENAVEVSENVARTLVGIEKDYDKILYDLNCELIEEELNKPTLYNMAMEEEEPTFTWDMLSDEVMPTPEHFACRIDKKTGEIYIGEGYENLFPFEKFSSVNCNTFFASLKNPTAKNNVLKTISQNANGDIYYLRYAKVYNLGQNDIKVNVNRLDIDPKTVQPNSAILNYEGVIEMNSTTHFQVRFDAFDIDTEIQFNIECPIITKTSTPKPFVRKFMPDGKLTLVTNATSETHSFVMKGINTIVKPSGVLRFHQTSTSTTGFERTHITAIDTSQSNIVQNNNVLISNKYAYILGIDKVITIADIGKSGGFLFFSPLAYKENSDSFKQLLIYKGNLTEEELMAENGKDIKLR